MTTAAPDMPPAVGQRALVIWRTLFILAMGIVYTSTHWPRLVFDAKQGPFDKYLHASAFGILAAMLWQTQWIRRRLWCVLAMMAWAAFDESTQAIPGLNRAAELDDYAADCLGILVTGFFLAASRPVPGALAGIVAERRGFLHRRLLDRPSAWIHIATGAVAGCMVGAVGSVLIDSRFRQPNEVAAMIVGAVLGTVAGALLMREFGVRSLQRRMMVEKPCLRCGASLQSAAPATGGHAGASMACPACGSANSPFTWTPFGMPDGSYELRAFAPIVGAGLAVVVAVGIFGPLLVAELHARYFHIFGGTAGRLPADLIRVGDITFVALVGAVCFRRGRVRLARALDRSGQHCLACGHDLRGIAHDGGTGRCTECGEPFLAITH